MYKLIAIDMDGTLLKEDKTISNENFSAIQKARKPGVKIVLATGRPLNGIKKYLSHLNLINEDDYTVVFGGAVVQNNKNEEFISHNILELEDWNYLFSLSKKLKVNIHALTENSCITPKDNKYSSHEATMNSIPLIIDNPSNMKENFSLIKIMFIDEPEILSKAIDKLPKELYDKYTIVRSAPFFLEFLNINANKGLGVESLAKSLNIKQEEVICIGDAGNDTHMVEYAGLGVAMENAFPELKEVANYITLSNENHGVAHVIDKFIFNN
ncbi:MAG: sugar-phosphatase [Clostridiaceae bacterium]|nr:sugar-phosphatase [Clostridiaceae bacterium]